MREVQVIARCDLKRCLETWSADPDGPPVLVSLPDGKQYELDLCPTHVKRFTDDWLVNGREAYQRPGTAGKKTSGSPASGTSVPCPVKSCDSRPTNASSMRAHLRNAHKFKLENISEIVAELFGTRSVKRIPCPDPECSESIAIHMVNRHMLNTHGVATDK